MPEMAMYCRYYTHTPATVRALILTIQMAFQVYKEKVSKMLYVYCLNVINCVCRLYFCETTCSRWIRLVCGNGNSFTILLTGVGADSLRLIRMGVVFFTNCF